MKRKIIILAIVMTVLMLVQGGAISFRSGGKGGSLKNVKEDYPIIGSLKSRLNRIFDTSFSLERDMCDPVGDWYADGEYHVPEEGIHSLEIRPSGQAIRLLKLRNGEDDIDVMALWQPTADENAEWWDLTAKRFPNQSIKLKPEAQQTVVVMKGGGTLSFATARDDNATIEFPIDE